MSDAIVAVGLGKRYYKRGIGPQTLFGSLRDLVTGRRPEEFWALRDATFSVKKGCTVGVIGPNGAGKSSTLGLAAGTITPTHGTIRTEGRVSSLLELGAGFHGDLTGRENIYLNASLLGIAREDIRRRFDAIVDFAGLHEFIDMPVRNYSSGMYVRLGFAVATEVDPDVLLVDEVLAVGDIEFQLRCLDRIRDFQRRGKTLMFVSHALQTVEEFCDEALLIHSGRIASSGEPGAVILDFVRSYMGEGGGIFTQEFGTRAVEMTRITLGDQAEPERATFAGGAPLRVRVAYTVHRRVENPVFGYSIKTANGMMVFGTNTQIAGHSIAALEPGPGHIDFHLNPLLLRHGNYFLSLAIHSWDHAEQYHRREDWIPFRVTNADAAIGQFTQPTQWDAPQARPTE